MIHPYLFFDGQCEEAVEFYRHALGAEVDMLMRYSDSPEPPPDALPAGAEDRIMHASFRIGDALVMASDGCGETLKFGGFSLSLTVPGQDEADRMFSRLADGGSVQVPLEKTFWSPYFGMVTDRFGVCWMITLPAQ